MSIIRFLGDVHGKFRRYSTFLDNTPYPTIQVGDMGVGFRRWPHGERGSAPHWDKMVAGGHRFIRGNHDSPADCARSSQYIADGTVEGNMMFVGGALSIDKQWRIEGYSWWPDEELSEDELLAMLAIYHRNHPQIMVTHDCPQYIAASIVATIPCVGNGETKLDPKFASRTREAFDFMLGHHRPKLWIFGHWHVPFDYMYQGTRFICIPELAMVDVDVDKAEVIEPETGPAVDYANLPPLDNHF